MPACRAATDSRTCHSEPGGEVELYSRLLTVFLEHFLIVTFHVVYRCVGSVALVNSVGWSLVDICSGGWLDSFSLVASLYGVYL